MTILRAAAVMALLLVLAGGAYVRVSPMPASRWQTNPVLASKSRSPNDYLLRPFGTGPGDMGGADATAPVYAVPFTDLARRLFDVATAEPGTLLIAGDWQSGDMTLVQRSRLLGYPDAISVRTIDLGNDTSSLAIWSRSRFGRYDWGMNRARVTRWLMALAGDLADPQPAP